MKFSWDNEKAISNVRKHGVSFDEAKAVFHDPDARLISDPDNSEDEERFVLLGMSKRPRLLVVCHCYRESDSVIRIISARKSTKHEAKMYKGFMP